MAVGVRIQNMVYREGLAGIRTFEQIIEGRKGTSLADISGIRMFQREEQTQRS